MNPRSALLPAAAVALSLLLSACGNKGPLVLPEPAPVETTPTAPGDVPVTIEPPVTLPQPETEGALRDPTAAEPLLVDPVTGPPPPGAEPYDAEADADADAEADADATDQDSATPPPPDDDA